MRRPRADEQRVIDTTLTTLRLEQPPRPDSIYNGADDDGSGSVAMIEIAEAFAAADEKPRRSILFVWHNAEEKGLLGARHFTDHPTVPRDAIVANINIDMIGRGSEGELEGGGPGYLQVIGSRRLSTELGDLVEEANTSGGFALEFDYQYDAEGHPQQFYCRSDHFMYARYGIPIVFFSTGSHVDYHQVTDEAQYINYDKMARVTQFIFAVAESIANLDHRLVVDQPKPDPNAPCRQ
jgi:Zn-dependent M28 family amino/carboxypeptidase